MEFRAEKNYAVCMWEKMIRFTNVGTYYTEDEAEIEFLSWLDTVSKGINEKVEKVENGLDWKSKKELQELYQAKFEKKAFHWWTKEQLIEKLI